MVIIKDKGIKGLRIRIRDYLQHVMVGWASFVKYCTVSHDMTHSNTSGRTASIREISLTTGAGGLLNWAKFPASFH